jgi:REP element-mobilizing transposase RayT
MTKPLRIEYPGAIHHVMSRGNLRRSVFEEEPDYQRLLQGPEQTVGRFGWDLLSCVLMPNHFHLFLRTPQPSLSRGMQYLASGYADWHAKRQRRPSCLTQDRFKAALVENERCFWTVSRYIHLNPVWGKQPLATHPADWPWSSYLGHAREPEVRRPGGPGGRRGRLAPLKVAPACFAGFYLASCFRTGEESGTIKSWLPRSRRWDSVDSGRISDARIRLPGPVSSGA